MLGCDAKTQAPLGAAARLGRYLQKNVSRFLSPLVFDFVHAQRRERIPLLAAWALPAERVGKKAAVAALVAGNELGLTRRDVGQKLDLFVARIGLGLDAAHDGKRRQGRALFKRFGGKA